MHAMRNDDGAKVCISSCNNGVNDKKSDKLTYRSLPDEEYPQNIAGVPF